MKFNVKKKEIEKAFSHSIALIPSRSSIVELNNALLELKNGKLTILTTDQKITFKTTIDVNTTDEGIIAVPIDIIYQTLKDISATDIQFIVDDENYKIKMKAGKGNYSISGIDAKKFPVVPSAISNNEIIIKTEDLKQIIKTIKFAVSPEEKRISMSGSLVINKQDKMLFVTTDGHKLVKYSIKTEKKKENQEIIIPLNTLIITEKVIEGETTKISTDGKLISLYFNNSVITSSLIEEKYPNYEAVIPTENNLSLRVDKQEFISSVKRVALYSNSTNYQIRLYLKKNEITISAKDADFGKEAQEEIQCEYSGEEMEIGFNAEYLIEVASHVPSDELIFKLHSPSKAVIIEPEKSKNEEKEILMLLMPLRLNV